MKMMDFGFRRGIDLGGWFSQCDYSEDRLEHFITEKDLDRIASWGLDHVRIPIDYNVVEDDDGVFNPDGFRRIGRALAWCKERNLKVVLDLHKTAGFSFDAGEAESGFFDSEKYQERFYRLWEELARSFYDPENVAFELLNEVTDASFIDAWNRISQECVRRIRPIAPDALILIGSYHNNSAAAVKDLAAPADSRVIYNFQSSRTRAPTGYRTCRRISASPLKIPPFPRITLTRRSRPRLRRRKRTTPACTAANTA